MGFAMSLFKQCFFVGIVSVLFACGQVDDLDAEGQQDTSGQDVDENQAGDTSAETAVEEERPQLADGDTDDYASNACYVLSIGSVQVIEAATSVVNAGQAILLPTGETAFKIKLPRGQKGYVTVEVADWMTMLAFFTEYDTKYTIDQRADIRTPRLWNAYCSANEITDQRIAFHEWGPYTLEFSAEGPREAWFMIQKMD